MHEPFDIARHPVVLQFPRRLSGVLSWVGHMPFGMLAVDLIRPRVLVELGTHAGDSYCSMCQAVRQVGAPTRCFAVDTWHGDEHSGEYGPEILAGLRAHHDELYGSFSTLMQMTFDEALSYFDDASVDLLHIDGLHTYEAVRHDFEAWLPKLSDRAVVMFHDTTVRRDDFGVWRLWAEVRQQYPHFEFTHSHGLGVLSVGKDEPQGLRAFREQFTSSAWLQDLFGQLGAGLVLSQEAKAFTRERDEARRQVADRDKVLADQVEVMQQQHASIVALQELNEETGKQLTKALADAANAGVALEDRRAMVLNLNHQLVTLQAAVRQERASLGYRSLNKARDAVHVAAPRGTNRRGLLLLTTKGASALIRGGPKGLKGRMDQVFVWPPRLVDAGRVPAATGEPNEDTWKLPIAEQYPMWLAQHALTPARLRSMQHQVGGFAHRPKISVVTPVYKSNLVWLRAAIESVRSQVYRNWELCIADDGSKDPALRRFLKRYALTDRRIKVTHLKHNRGIAGATNAALAMATGEFIAFLDHDDELTPDALFEVVKRLNAEPDLDFLYSDEDKLEPDGRRSEVFFKPDYSPDLLLCENYVTHFSVYRKSVLDQIGGLRTGFDGSQDYDLVLRAIDVTDRIGHIPKPIYHWRKIPGSAAEHVDAKPYAYDAAKKALKEHLERAGIDATVQDGTFKGSYRVRYPIPGEPKVAIIIPTRDRVDLLSQCIDSIRERSTYSNYELLVVDNNSQEEATAAYLAGFGGRVLHDPGIFNFSRMMNLAARQARDMKADALLLLNNDTEVVTPEWLEAMLEHALRPEVGAVGVRLKYPDGRIQHEGVFIGIVGDAANVDHADYFGLGTCVRNWSAVTAACMMVRPSVYEQLGGFDEHLRVAFNDVDFCLRAVAQGYRIVYTPHATLTHHESASRGTLHPGPDERFFRERWGKPGDYRDPYYNPNFSPVYPFKVRLDGVEPSLPTPVRPPT